MSESEFQKFDATVKKILSVSRDEMEKRDKEWGGWPTVRAENATSKLKWGCPSIRAKALSRAHFSWAVRVAPLFCQRG